MVHRFMGEEVKARDSKLKDHIHTHQFNGPLSVIIRVSWYQKGKTNLDFTEARDSEWHGISWVICKSAPQNSVT